MTIAKIRAFEAGAAGRRILVAVGAWLALMILSDSLCFWQATVGVPCPGCGSTRAALALFRGDVSGAIRWHPLIFLTLALAPYLVARQFILSPGSAKKSAAQYAAASGPQIAKRSDKASDQTQKKRRRGALTIEARAMTCVAALYFVVYIVRMILYFPRQEPMVPLETSLLRRALDLLAGVL